MEIKIIVDNRYDPPETAMLTSQLMPGSLIQGHMLDASLNVNQMWQQAEANAAKPGAPPSILAALQEDLINGAIKINLAWRLADKMATEAAPPNLPPAPDGKLN